MLRRDIISCHSMRSRASASSLLCIQNYHPFRFRRTSCFLCIYDAADQIPCISLAEQFRDIPFLLTEWQQ